MKVSLNLKDFRRKLVLPSDLVQYNLLKFNKSMDKAWFHIRSIYYNILLKDDKWHFFYEGDFSIIRCQRKYKTKLEKYLNEYKIEYDFKGKWLDDHYMVVKYMEHFEPMFHAFSMLAIEMPEYDLMPVADRVVHPFFNHCSYMAKDYRSKFGEHSWEAYLMANMAAGRGVHAGRVIQEESWKASVGKVKEAQPDVECPTDPNEEKTTEETS